jgi:hypothetical protein
MTDAEELTYFTEVLKRLDALRERAPKDSLLPEAVAEASEAIAGLIGYFLADNELPLDPVFEDLREKIHPQPTAMKFVKGDRVKLSAKGIEMMPRMSAERSGTIAFNQREGSSWLAVQWDGTSRARYIDPNVLDGSDD